MYVILRDEYQYLGDGHHSGSENEFCGIVKDFETARNVIEYLIDYDIEQMAEYWDSNVTLEDENWNEISINIDDAFETWFRYHFIKFEL